MEEDRVKWNDRFASEEAYLGLRPSPFLLAQLDRIGALVPGRQALDLACGEGRNSILLAKHGYSVTGVDISDVGLAKARQRAESAGVKVSFEWADLEDFAFDRSYDLIINFNFLLRKLIPEAYGALTPGGIMIVDSILETEVTSSAHNKDYLLRQGELNLLFSALEGEILFIEEVEKVPAGQMPTARVLFKKRCP